MSVRCHDCAKLQKIWIFNSPLSNQHTFWTVSQICQFKLSNKSYLFSFFSTTGYSAPAYPLSSTPAANSVAFGGGKMKRERSSARVSSKRHEEDEVKIFYFPPPPKKASWKNDAWRKPFTWSVKYFCSWKYNKPLLIFWLQVPELPDLPPISLPISSTTALPTFSFTSPLLSSTISKKPSVTVTSAKEEIKVKVCLQIKSLTY